MPQVDKATFFPIVFWTFIIYSTGYLFLNTTFLYGFFTGLKLQAKRALGTYSTASRYRQLTSILLLFPLVSL
jgi:hypothetical protein